MAYSKTFLLLGILLAVILVLSHDVSAGTSQQTEEGGVQVDSYKKDDVHADGHHGGGWGGGGHGWGGGRGGGGCRRGSCCRGPHCKAADKVDAHQAAENGGDHN